jgi:hypothetical protein
MPSEPIEPLFDTVGWVHRPDGSLATDEDGEPITVRVEWERHDAE